MIFVYIRRKLGTSVHVDFRPITAAISIIDTGYKRWQYWYCIGRMEGMKHRSKEEVHFKVALSVENLVLEVSHVYFGQAQAVEHKLFIWPVLETTFRCSTVTMKFIIALSLAAAVTSNQTEIPSSSPNQAEIPSSWPSNQTEIPSSSWPSATPTEIPLTPWNNNTWNNNTWNNETNTCHLQCQADYGECSMSVYCSFETESIRTLQFISHVTK